MGEGFFAGIDVGSECVKAVVLDSGGAIAGRAVVSTVGYFQTRVEEVLTGALEEAGATEDQLVARCVTGYGAPAAKVGGMFATEAACHARGAARHHPAPMIVLDVGGRNPGAVVVDDDGRWLERRTMRKCAVGTGSFLMFTARHLDVHPTRLMELATAAERIAPIGSYCSVFSENAIIARLRDGWTRSEIALGCVHSIAERLMEIGVFEHPVVVTGGVPEYFPGVIDAFMRMAGVDAQVVPEPIMAGAIGAALIAYDATLDDGGE